MREGMQGERREGGTKGDARENRLEVHTCMLRVPARTLADALIYTSGAWVDAPAAQLRWILLACDVEAKTRERQRGRQTSEPALASRSCCGRYCRN